MSIFSWSPPLCRADMHSSGAVYAGLLGGFRVFFLCFQGLKMACRHQNQSCPADIERLPVSVRPACSSTRPRCPV